MIIDKKMNYFRLFLYLYTIGYRAYFYVLHWGQKKLKDGPEFRGHWHHIQNRL